MTISTKATHITPADGNVFADLGFDPQEAAALLAETDRVIFQKLAIKQSLAEVLVAWMDAEGLDPAAAADALCVTSQSVSQVIHNKGAGVTIDALVTMLLKAGKRVMVTAE